MLYKGSWIEGWNKAGFSVCGIDQQSHGFSESLHGFRCYVDKFDHYVEDVLHFARSVALARFSGERCKPWEGNHKVHP